MKKAIWKGIFCILVVLLFILPANAAWMEKMKGARENNEFLQMNSPIDPIEKRWSRRFGRILGQEIGFSVEQTNDGGYIVAGTKQLLPYSFSPFVPLFLDVWLIKTDKMGKAMDLRSKFRGLAFKN